MRVVFILLALGAVGVVAFQFPLCPRDKVQKSCGCVTTCEDIENDITCTGCESGCFCQDGEVEYDGECSDPSVCVSEEVPPEDNEEFPDSDDENPEDGAGMVSDSDSDDENPEDGAGMVSDSDSDDENPEDGAGMVSDSDSDDENPEDGAGTDSDSDDENENDCPGDKIYNPCGSACPPTCEDTDQLCALNCEEGCFCPAGTVDYKGKCLDPDECPGVTTEPMECGANETYSECGNACTQNCDNRDEIFFCAAVCKEGCFCKENYFRNANEECVAVEDCESNGESEEPLECGENEIVKDCETVCKEGILSLICSDNEPMCGCAEGFVRSEGECVDVKACEKRLVDVANVPIEFKQAIPEEVDVPIPAPTSDPILVPTPVLPKPYICKRDRHGRRHHRHHQGRHGGNGNRENGHDRHEGDEDRDCPPKDRIYIHPNPHPRPMQTPLPRRPFPPPPGHQFQGPPPPGRPPPGAPRDKDRSENGRGGRHDGRAQPW